MARRGENIYKRKDGRYEGRYIKFYNSAGKAVYGYLYSKSYTDLKERLKSCKTEKWGASKGMNIPLGEWMNTWLSSLGTTRKPTTQRVYKSHIENHINPALGAIPLKKLNAEQIQNFVNDLNLSAATVKTIFATLKSALISAGGVAPQVWSGVKMPKSEKFITRVLSVEEQKRLENALSGDSDIGIFLCLYTGLRIGELCALRWEDIHLERAVLTVNGTQARTEKGVEIISPKSKSAKREIPLPPFLLEKIKRLPRTGEFVISRFGRPFDIRTYRRHFKHILNKADLPDIKFHALRHTFATRALEVGMDYKTLSEILGHSTVSITLDLYAHSLNEHKKKQMNKLGGIFQL